MSTDIYTSVQNNIEMHWFYKKSEPKYHTAICVLKIEPQCIEKSELTMPKFIYM